MAAARAAWGVVVVALLAIGVEREGEVGGGGVQQPVALVLMQMILIRNHWRQLSHQGVVPIPAQSVRGRFQCPDHAENALFG